MSTVRITILVDNYVRQRGLLAEHGWACWVETPTCRLLFDTGQGPALQPNARELGIPLETANAIVLSHGHYDHTGALGEMLNVAPAAESWVVPLSPERLAGIARAFTPPAEVIATHHKHTAPCSGQVTPAAVLGLLQRRPCTHADIAAGLAAHRHEVIKILDELMAECRVHAEMVGEQPCFVLNRRTET